MARRFYQDAKVVQMGPQADISTEPNWAAGGESVVFAAEFDPPDATYGAADWAASLQQFGARPAPLPGRRGATFSLRMPLHALLSGYAWADGVAGKLSPDALILSSMLGGTGNPGSAAAWISQGHCKVNNDVAAAVKAGSTSTAVKLDGNGAGTVGAAGITPGDFFATRDAGDDDGNAQAGWVKSTTVPGSPADETVTLYEASAITAASGDNVLSTATAFYANQQPTMLGFQILGPNAAFREVLIGCQCVGAELELKFGDQAWVRFDFVAADYQRRSTGGGLVAVTAQHHLVPRLNSVNGGRFTYGASGTGSATNVAAWKDLKLKITCPWERIESAAGIQGWGTPAQAAPEIILTGSVALDSADTIDSGYDHQLVSDFVSEARKSIAWTAVGREGRIFSLFLPSLVHLKAPAQKASGERGMIYHEVEMGLGVYTTDAASTNAGNSLLRLGWA